MKIPAIVIRCFILFAIIQLCLCASLPVKQYYLLSYIPEAPKTRIYQAPYPYTVRLKDFDIEEAYSRPQIVYRKSPFELQFYFYKIWAVKPTRMITDLAFQHLYSVNLFSRLVRRFDEGYKPEYEITGTIEAIEEYDSDEVWFAHLAINIRCTRISDGRAVYQRRFDNVKQVYQHQPEQVIKELSWIMDNLMSQVVIDLDKTFAREYGVTEPAAPTSDSLSR